MGQQGLVSVRRVHSQTNAYAHDTSCRYPFWHFCFRQPDTSNGSLCLAYFATYCRMWFYGGFIVIGAIVGTQMLWMFWVDRSCSYTYALGKVEEKTPPCGVAV